VPALTDAGAPDWRRNLAAVTVATFIGFTGFTLVMPFLPLYFEQLGVKDTGAIAVWSGVSLGVTPAVTALMAPVWARVAERYGRKLMVARSLFSFVVIMGAMAYVTAPWQVFALRAVQGFFAGYGMLALTMAFRPEVLMLDEPLAGLDPVVREQILNTVIHELSERGCTVFLSSHEILEVEKVCDRATIISNGRLILDMETDALKSGVRRILLTLTSPVEILPSHPSILSVKSRGTELDIVVKDFDENLVGSLTSNLKVKDRKVEGLTLQEIFINLTHGREEKS